MYRVRRALVSVSDRRGLVDFAAALVRHDCEIIASGGTRKVLEAAGVRVTEVAAVTGNPEAFGGRMKTYPIYVDGDMLRVNAATDPGGFVLVEIEDETGAAVLDQPFRFEGDDVAADVADVSSLKGTSIRVSFTLHHARLYAFEVAQTEEAAT